MENSLSYYRKLLMENIEEKELSDKQKKIAKLDPPADEIDAGDFGKLRAGAKIEEEGDHEVSMANNSLETIIKHAMDLKSKLGNEEKDIPAWIQDHITNAANFISQAAENYHEYGDHEGEELAENISITIPEDTDYKDFASEVANILKKDYGEHNFQPFIKALSDELSKQDDMTEELSLQEILKNIKNGHK